MKTDMEVSIKIFEDFGWKYEIVEKGWKTYVVHHSGRIWSTVLVDCFWTHSGRKVKNAKRSRKVKYTSKGKYIELDKKRHYLEILQG